MDLNHLFHRHQLSLMLEHEAGSREARLAHRRAATDYASRISALQQDLGATFATVPA